MNFKAASTPNFARELKPLLKKYPSLKSEMKALVTQLETDPFKGTSLGNGCFKIRLAIGSKNKGKSGGARIITYVIVADETVFLISIYDKSDQTDIEPNEIKNIINSLRPK